MAPPSTAPIAFFAFNRPGHTAATLQALASNPLASDSDLRVFVDGPRNAGERDLVEDVVRISERASGFRSVTLHRSPVNRGLFRAITEGVTQVVSDAGRVIVVEDDVLVSPYFLSYIHEALERFSGEPRVGSIHGYSPRLPDLPDYFFLRGADCWGWATWADRWSLFDPDAHRLLSSIVQQKRLAGFAASHGWQSVLQLSRRAKGRNQSWAILWHASLFLAGRYTLHPGASLVRNIGNDGSGVHSNATEVHATSMATRYNGIPALTVEEDASAAAALSRFLDAQASGRMGQRMLRTYAKLAARAPFLLP